MDLESRLKGSWRGSFLDELLTNSLQFPLANIFLELLLEGPQAYLRAPDLYAITLAGVLQALVIGTWRHRGVPRPLVGNLIGPALYSAFELSLEGWNFFASPNHIAYWVFALAIGLLQAAQPRVAPAVARVLLVIEHVTRTCILLAMYAFFEALTDPANATVAGFLSDSSHRYVALVIPLLGLLLGFANLTARAYLQLLQETAGQLRRFSSWLLGAQRLSQAVADPDSLRLQRRERCVLFMDIRGFTAWSEAQPADAVVELLNGYFAAAEQVLAPLDVVKAQFIGDEVLCVLESPAAAVDCARQFRAAERRFLGGFGLAAGIGVHRGVVVEGLIGSAEIKSFTVVGDTVNSAKRVCDSAAGGEVLLSQALRGTLDGDLALGPARALQLKGKREPMTVWPLD